MTSRRLATGLCVTYGVLFLARMALALSTGSLDDQSGFWFNLLSAVMISLFPLLFLAVGWAIVTRQPRNTIGWLLLAIPLIGMLGFFVGDYATQALKIDPGSLPFGRAAAWLDRWLIVAALGVFIPLFLLFPDGRVPSRRWRPALWLVIGSTALTIVGFALTPGVMTGAFADLEHAGVTNPLGIDALAGPIAVITGIGGLLMLVAAIVSGAAIVSRFRHASGEVRQQIKWLAFVGVAFLLEIPLTVVVDAITRSDTASNVMFLVGFGTLIIGIPLACGVAILKYRLYDLDVVVRKTVVFGLLAVFVAVVYAGVVGLLGALVGGVSNSVASFVAATVLAIAFQPARERARRLADRLVYGQRATPYEVLADFSSRVGEAYAADDVLPRMAQVLASGTGAESATVWLRVGEELHPVATSPPDAEPGRDHAVEVVHQGESLGELSVVLPPSDPIGPAKDKLIRDLAAQAGLVLRNFRLIEELRASRQRLVAAQDEERRRIERNLHDGVQQQLVALNVQLGLLARAAGGESKVAEMATAMQTRATEALEDLRDLARGIYPPLLADRGLAAALESQARKAVVPTTVEADGIGRYPQEVEAAVYFCLLEALNNTAKYAQASRVAITLAQTDALVTFTFTDDGVGFDASGTTYGTGLQGMRDRLDAIGGSFAVVSSPGEGTTVTGTVPVTAEEGQPLASSQADSSRSGPNDDLGM
jgi:signal transduction histidine kinase